MKTTAIAYTFAAIAGPVSVGRLVPAGRAGVRASTSPSRP
jgi:hypothetical protein